MRLTFLTALLFASLAALHAGELRLIGAGGYTFTAALPPAELGLTLNSGQRLRADLGVTLGDPGGTDTNLRSHWSNKSTGLVDDIPGEITLTPVLSKEMNPDRHPTDTALRESDPSWFNSPRPGPWVSGTPSPP